MTEETSMVDATLGPGRILAALGQGATGNEHIVKILKKVRPVYLVSGPITEGQNFPSYIDLSGRVRVTAGEGTKRAAVNISGVGFDLDGLVALGLFNVGDIVELWCVGAPGVNCVGQAVSATGAMVIEALHGALRLQNGGAAANRTMIGQWRLGTQRAWAAAAPDFVTTTSGAVIVNQYGGIIELPNGLEQTNINGVITSVVGRSPFPVKVDLEPGSVFGMASVIGLIAAADVVAMQTWVRRVE